MILGSSVNLDVLAEYMRRAGWTYDVAHLDPLDLEELLRRGDTWEPEPVYVPVARWPYALMGAYVVGCVIIATLVIGSITIKWLTGET